MLPAQSLWRKFTQASRHQNSWPNPTLLASVCSAGHLWNPSPFSPRQRPALCPLIYSTQMSKRALTHPRSLLPLSGYTFHIMFWNLTVKDCWLKSCACISHQPWTPSVDNNSGQESSQVCTKQQTNKQKAYPSELKSWDSIKVITLFRYILTSYRETYNFKVGGSEQCGVLLLVTVKNSTMYPANFHRGDAQNTGWICVSRLVLGMSCKTYQSGTARRHPSHGKNLVAPIKTGKPHQLLISRASFAWTHSHSWFWWKMLLFPTSHFF